MVRIENDCVGCQMPCLGNSCQYRNVKHYYCDECGEEKQLYEFEYQELCLDCIESRLNKVDGSF